MNGNIEYTTIDEVLAQFSPQAKLWVYTSSRKLNKSEVLAIHSELDRFMPEWNTHGNKLTSQAFVLHHNFLVFIVDEQAQYASGCSIDSKVNFVKSVGHKYDLDFFDRFRFVYLDKNQDIYNLSKSQFADLYKIGKVDDDTIVFDALVNTVDKFNTAFKKKLSASWHHRFIG